MDPAETDMQALDEEAMSRSIAAVREHVRENGGDPFKGAAWTNQRLNEIARQPEPEEAAAPEGEEPAAPPAPSAPPQRQQATPPPEEQAADAAFPEAEAAPVDDAPSGEDVPQEVATQPDELAGEQAPAADAAGADPAVPPEPGLTWDPEDRRRLVDDRQHLKEELRARDQYVGALEERLRRLEAAGANGPQKPDAAPPAAVEEEDDGVELHELVAKKVERIANKIATERLAAFKQEQEAARQEESARSAFQRQIDDEFKAVTPPGVDADDFRRAVETQAAHHPTINALTLGGGVAGARKAVQHWAKALRPAFVTAAGGAASAAPPAAPRAPRTASPAPGAARLPPRPAAPPPARPGAPPAPARPVAGAAPAPSRPPNPQAAAYVNAKLREQRGRAPQGGAPATPAPKQHTTLEEAGVAALERMKAGGYASLAGGDLL